MNDPTKCPECGSDLAPTTGEPMCPVCLLKNVVDPTDSGWQHSAQMQTQSIGADGFDSMRSVGGTEPRNLPDGSTFGDYRIVRRLGHGGMGVVYEAIHTPTSRHVALKVLGHALDDRESRARFLREGRLAASINHPNSVYVYGTEEIDGIPTISMELVPGGTLNDRIRKLGPMPIRQAVDAILQIIDGLEAADRCGVLHRDIKPANCFIAPDGSVKIGDFGLSISTSTTPTTTTDITQKGTFLGTPAFASPEQLRGEPLDRRSDIYAVGVTLYYLLSGSVPFTSENMVQLLAKVLDTKPPELKKHRSNIPADLERIVSKCLEKSSADRFESYETLREALQPHSSSAPIAATLGNRTLAGMIDVAVCWTLVAPVSLYGYLNHWFTSEFGPTFDWKALATSFFSLILLISYYGLSEWKYGQTVGKWMMGIRVIGISGAMTLRQCLIRSTVFVAVPVLPNLIFNILFLSRNAADFYSGVNIVIALSVGWSYYLIKAGLFAPARARNYYAAVHDRVSKTLVVARSLPSPQESGAEADESFDLASATAKIGPYHRLKALYEFGEEKLVLGYDAQLLRRVWIHIQPIGTPELPPPIRDLSRPSRLRWLGGARSDTECWDCYEAPRGTALLSESTTAEAHQILNVIRSVIDELVVSKEENSLPPGFNIDQLWHVGGERIKALPFPAPGVEKAQAATDDAPTDAFSREVGIVRRMAGHLLDQVTPSRQSKICYPISTIDRIRRLKDSETLEEASALTTSPGSDQPIRLPQRLVGLVVTSLSLPIITFATLALGALLFHRQSEQFPDIDRLATAHFVRSVEARIPSDEQYKRLKSIDQYINGNFRELFDDKERMGSFYATIKIPPPNRVEIREILKSDLPTDVELVEATRVFEELRDEYEPMRVAVTTMSDPSQIYMMSGSNWLVFVWIPSLATALFVREGLLMRLFGLVFLNRRGQRASRARIFWRNLLSGLLVMLLVYTYMFVRVLNWQSQYRFLIDLAFPAIITLMVVWSISTVVRTKRQFLSDRLSGTYLAPR